jgi:hypothetical protein
MEKMRGKEVYNTLENRNFSQVDPEPLQLVRHQNRPE